MSSHESAEKRKVQSIQKKRKSVERSTPVRSSPRKKLAIENVISNAENQCSKSTEVQPAVVNNNSEINSVKEETKKEEDTSKRSYPDLTNRLQTEGEETDSAVKLNVKRSRTLQWRSKNSISTEKSSKTGDFLEGRCNGHQKAKRQLIDEASKKRILMKRAKPAHQIDQADGERSLENDESVELSNKRTLNHENGFEEKELGVIGENHVDDSAGVADKESDEAVGINTSATSDVSSDDELLSDAFSPSQEGSKFIAFTVLYSIQKLLVSLPELFELSFFAVQSQIFFSVALTSGMHQN